MNVKPGVIKTCPQCGVEFRRPPSQGKARFCGAACWFAHHTAKEKVCQQCGKIFRRSGPGRNEGSGQKFCSKACQGVAALRRVEFRCMDCGRVQMRRPNEVRRFRRCRECGAAYRAARLKGQPLPSAVDPVARESWLRALQTPEYRERMSEIVTGREMQTEITRRNSPRHFKALHFTVRSPAGVPYQVDNLCRFVRSHPHLFDPADVVDRSRLRASYRSRATAGLRMLQARVGTRLSWKGWTLTFGCLDELERQPMEVEEARRHASDVLQDVPVSGDAIRTYENN